MKQGAGKNGLQSGRQNMVNTQGDRDPFWKKDEAKAHPSPGPSTTATAEPGNLATPEEIADWIAKRAYELYEARGRSDGNDQDDWFKAEQEILHYMRKLRDEEEG